MKIAYGFEIVLYRVHFYNGNHQGSNAFRNSLRLIVSEIARFVDI